MDFDDDGRIDLLCGEFNGIVHHYHNVGTAAEPVLEHRGILKYGEQDIQVGLYAVPRTVDWNADGLLDLIVGGSDGRVRLYINEGMPGRPVFLVEQFVQDGGVDLTVGNRAAPCIGDLDGDGLWDLAVGDYWGRVRFFRNEGQPGAPLFSGGEFLACSGETIRVQSCIRPYAVDWTGDGDLDLVAGRELSVPVLYESDPREVLMPDLAVDFLGPSGVYPGDSVSFKVALYNPHAQPLTFDLFTGAQSLGKRFFGPGKEIKDVVLGGGQSIEHTFTQKIPLSMPTGGYHYTVFTGRSRRWMFTRAAPFYFTVQ